MRILAIQPGASYSTHDVYVGVVSALENLGHEIIHYRLDGRISSAGAWFKYQANRAKRSGQPFAYTSADVVYKASVDSVERALRFQPDFVLVVSGMYFHPDAFIMLRRAGLRVGVLLTESPYDEEKEAKILPFVDIAWTNERTSVPRLREMSGNEHVYYLPHAYDPARHYPGLRPGDDAVPAHDVVFVGTYFHERLETLSAVDWTGIDLGLYGDHTQIPSRSKLRQSIAGGITDNAMTASLYRRAKIGLNLHRTSIGFGRGVARIEYAESLNPRAYELAASGCFQISDWRKEVNEVFDGAVATFASPRDLEGQIRFYLGLNGTLVDPTAHRLEWAEIARQRVQDHTFTARAQQIIEDISRVQRRRTAAAV